MTKEDILNMPAGRKTDALIAKEVMRWENVHYRPFKISGGDYFGIIPRGKYKGTLFQIPHYSTRIDSAWQVVYKMHQLGYINFKLQLVTAPDDKNIKTWIAEFTCPFGPCKIHGTDFHNWHGVTDVEAPTEQLAICRAALLAVTSH